MNYIFKGRLCGYLCNDCSEPLANVKVRLYKPSRAETITLLAVADANQTFHQVTEEERKGKQKLLIAEASTDASGAFTFQLSEKEKYSGEAFEIDFVCGNNYNKPVPPKKYEEFQFHITTIQPQWREKTSEQTIASYFGWEYCVPSKWWCQILRLLDLWVICGRVISQATNQPIPGVRVEAFDVDLLQDDAIGSNVTDASGHFRIYYTSAEFSKTIFSWLNIEWPAGPDIYFKLYDNATNTLLLEEDRSVGHRADRENRSNCFCVRLVIDFNEPPTQVSAWTSIGNFTIPDGSSLNDFDAIGFASSARYALTGIITLAGQVPRKNTSNNRPVEYRFSVSTVTADNGTPPVPASNFTSLIVGKTPGLFGGGCLLGKMIRFTPTIRIVNVFADLTDFDGDGWLDVNNSILRTFTADPTLNPADLSIPNLWHWVDDDPLVTLNTAILVPPVPVPPVAAGNAVPIANRIQNKKIAIRFEVREVINKALNQFIYLPANGQTMNSITVNNDISVVELAINEQSGGGDCNTIGSNVHVSYTVHHADLQSASIHVRSNDLAVNKYLSDGFMTLSGNTNDAITHNNNNSLLVNNTPVNDLKKCSYLVTLSVQRRLHTGYGIVGPEIVQKTFCYQ
jgi:5-hydroxyisourate hydrolase-like protein (transthyretin family)